MDRSMPARTAQFSSRYSRAGRAVRSSQPDRTNGKMGVPAAGYQSGNDDFRVRCIRREAPLARDAEPVDRRFPPGWDTRKMTQLGRIPVGGGETKSKTDRDRS